MNVEDEAGKKCSEEEPESEAEKKNRDRGRK